jgi:site-specific recombinase XerD
LTREHWSSELDPTNIVRSVTAKILGEDKRLTPLAFRRSMATELIRRGANPGHVKDLLGPLPPS